MCSFTRSTTVSLVPLLFTLSAFPQEGTAPAKEESLYSVALCAGLAEMEKSWGYIDDSYMGGVRTDYRHMIVQKDPVITDRLPSQFGDYRVEYLDRRAQIDRYKKLGKGFSILRIRPMQNVGSRLKIQVDVSYFTHEERKWMYGVSDWSDGDFRYDCEKQKFVVPAVKLGGI